VEDEGRPRDDELEVSAREQNSNLKRLIDAVSNLLVSSRELLGRLREPDEPARKQSEEPPSGSSKDTTSGDDDAGT
jgi:hypothetical protein